MIDTKPDMMVSKINQFHVLYFVVYSVEICILLHIEFLFPKIKNKLCILATDGDFHVLWIHLCCSSCLFVAIRQNVKWKVSRIRVKWQRKREDFIIFTPFLTHFTQYSPPQKKKERKMHKLKRQLELVATALHIFLIYVNFIPFISYFFFGKAYYIQRTSKRKRESKKECVSDLRSNRVRT